MFLKAGAEAEKALFLDPARQNCLTDGFCCMPSLPECVGWADVMIWHLEVYPNLPIVALCHLQFNIMGLPSLPSCDGTSFSIEQILACFLRKPLPVIPI